MQADDAVVIAPAVDAADAEWSAALMAASDPWITLGRDLAACRKSVGRPGGELFLARAAATGERLGFMVLHPHGVAGKPYVAILAVAPPARGRGLGTRMLEYAERRYPDTRHIFICVSDFNTDARRLYERHGYTLVGAIPDLAAEGHSELLLHRRVG